MTATSDDIRQEKVHATAVAIAGSGVLIRGASGSGKSDLALRLIDRGAILISDDLKSHPDRFPLDRQIMILLGIEVPTCTLDAMESSAAIKAEWALQRIMQGAIES